jgi:hypothetical protein
MSHANDFVPSIPYRRQQCDSASSGNKPEEVQILSRHQFFRRSGEKGVGGDRGRVERRIRGMALAIHNIGKRASHFTSMLGVGCRLLNAGCAWLFVAGCATDPVPMGSRFVVAAPFAEFYKNGPATDVNLDIAQHTFNNYLLEQHTGPDFQLPQGAAVTMLKRESGYSKVITDSGIAGFVANDKLKPAPPVARAAPTEMPPERNFRQRTRAVPPSRKNDEQLDFNDLPLPS